MLDLTQFGKSLTNIKQSNGFSTEPCELHWKLQPKMKNFL